MPRLQMPLDPSALQVANEAVAKQAAGRTLTMSPADAALRAQWLAAYTAAAAPAQPAANCTLGSAVHQCPYASQKAPPPRKVPPQREKPCDFSDVILAETPGKRGQSYKWDRTNKAWVESAEPAKSRRVSALGGGGAEKSEQFQLLADRAGDAAAGAPTKVAVTVLPGPGYHNPMHPQLTVDSKMLAVSYEGSAATAASFPVYRTTYSGDDAFSGPRSLADRLFPPVFGAEPNIYSVRVDSCGNPAGAARPVRSAVFQLSVFPADVYTVAIVIPPFRKTTHKKARSNLKRESQDTVETNQPFGNRSVTGASAETEYGEHGTETSASATTTGRDGLVRTDKFTRKQGDGIEHSTKLENGGTSVTLAPASATPVKVDYQSPTRVQLELRRNSVLSSNAVPLKEIVDYLIYYEHKFKELWDSIKQWKPEVGWDFDLQYSWMSGELAYAWGFKRTDDWRVARWRSIKASLTVFQIDLTVSFGLKWSKIITAQISGSAKGEYKLVFDREWLSTSGDTEDQALAKCEGSVEISFKGLFSIGVSESICTKREGGVKWGIDVEGGLHVATSQGAYISGKWTIRPVTVYYISKSWIGPDEENDREITEGDRDQPFRFPSETVGHGASGSW